MTAEFDEFFWGWDPRMSGHLEVSFFCTYILCAVYFIVWNVLVAWL